MRARRSPIECHDTKSIQRFECAMIPLRFNSGLKVLKTQHFQQTRLRCLLVSTMWWILNGKSLIHVLLQLHVNVIPAFLDGVSFQALQALASSITAFIYCTHEVGSVVFNMRPLLNS